MNQEEQIEKLIQMEINNTLNELIGKTLYVFSQECIIVGVPKKILPSSYLLLVTNNINTNVWLPLTFYNIEDSFKNTMLNSRTELLKQLASPDSVITDPELFNSPKHTYYGFLSLVELLTIKQTQMYKIDFISYLGNIIKEIQNELI
jgi:hypothetical protein